MSAKTNPLEQIKFINQQSEFPKSLLIISPDNIRIHRALEMITVHFKLFNNSKWLCDLKKYKLSELTVPDIEKIGFSSKEMSLFSNQKIFWIDNLESINAAKTEALLEIISEHGNNSSFILTASSLKSNSKLYKHHQKNKTIVNLPEFSQTELVRWIKKECNNLKLNLNSQVAELICEMSEGSADSALSFIEILDLYSENKTINENDLVDIFPIQSNLNEFKWIDEINNKQIAKAETSLNLLLDSGKNSLSLLGLLYYNFLNYYLVCKLIESGTKQSEIRQKLGLAPWIFNKYLAVSKQTDSKGLQSKLASILMTDSKIKNKSFGEENIFSELINKLAA